MPAHPCVNTEALVTFCYTTDGPASFRFYEEVLGLPLALDEGKARIYRVAGDAYLGVCERERPPATDGVMITLVTEDVDGACARLRVRGAKIAEEPNHLPEFKVYRALVEDPNGYLIEIQRFENPAWAGRPG